MADVCEICGKKIGGFSGAATLSGYPGIKVCSNCETKFTEMCYYGEQYVQGKRDSARFLELYAYFTGHKGTTTPQAQKAIEDSTQNVFQSIDQQKQKQAQQAQQRQELKQHIDNILLTTGSSFDGYRVQKYLGILTADVVMGTGFLSELSASLSDLLGVNDNAFSLKMERAREIAEEKLLYEAATKAGANALLGVKYDYEIFSGNLIAVTICGTAVLIEKE